MSGAPGSASVLLVDIGNTRIKWAFWRAGRLSRVRAEAYTGWSSKDFTRHLFGSDGSSLGRGGAARARVPARLIVASVAAESVLRQLTAAARQANRLGERSSSIGRASPVTGRGSPVIPELIATSRRAAGVVTRYREPWRLGVDRFLGVIAAHHLAGSRGACVINAGTAVTLDLVDGHGVHWGGAILPGPRLMIDSLLQRTAGIARRARGGPRRAASRTPHPSGHASFFARDTAAAIEQGATHAVAGAVERAIAGSRRHLGGVTPLVILTGGGAADLRRTLGVRCTEVPDLVLRGIALRAGLALR